jgi:hypothetical protein
MAQPATPNPTSQDQSNNKTDTLTQSQMFKAFDKGKFLECQADEINSLYALIIMDAYPTSSQVNMELQTKAFAEWHTIQVQITPVYQWKRTSFWKALLGDVRSRSSMVHYSPTSLLIHHHESFHSTS